MSEVICRGSFALGTACGRCSKCKAQKDQYQLQKSVRESLDGTASLKARIEALEAGIIAALREDDANMRPILRKALHGGAGE